jgi:phage shock protein PspC (stress-responsive transcriptional regulator)
VDDRLYRSATDRVIAGVAGGIAAWIQVDPSIVRIAWVLGAVFSFGLFVLVYFVMMIVVPLAPPGWAPRAQPRATPGGNAIPGWGQGPAGPGPGPTTPGPTTPGAQAGPGAQASFVPPTSSGPQAGPAPAPAWQPSGQVSWDSAAAARRGRLAGGTVLVVLGLWLLVGQYIDIDWNLLWPLFVMGAGVLLIAAALRRRGG